MKLLLTSGGLANQSIINSLKDLVVRPFNQLNLAFIPTAANIQTGDKQWLVRDLSSLLTLDFKTIDIVDISALPPKIWQQRMDQADVLVFGGGNAYHLLYWIHKSGLIKILPKYLETKIYLSISAGTSITGPNLSISTQTNKMIVRDIGEEVFEKGLHLVDFLVQNHVNNPHFPDRTFAYVKQISLDIPFPVYALDDQSAIKVVDDQVEVISEGQWQLFPHQ